MAWSENYKYKNPDITGLVDNVKRMMGVDSGAGGRRSRNMSDFLTGAKTEGQQLKNTQQDILVKAIQAAVGQSGLDDDERLLRAATTSSTDIGGGLSKEAMLASQLAEQEGKAQLQQQKVEQGNLIASLAKRLEVGGSPAHGKRVMTMPQGLPGSNVEVPARGYSEGDQERWARLIRTLQGGQVGTDMDWSGGKGERKIQSIEKKDGSVVSYNETRARAVAALTEPKVKEIEAKTQKILSDMGINSNIGTARINKINQAALDAVLLAQQKGLNLKETNTLIKKNIEIAAEKLVGEGFATQTKESKSNILKKEDEAKGGELYLNKRQLEVKLETLKQKLLRETENAKIAALNQQYAKTLKKYEVEIGKQNTAKATSQASKADSGANIAGQNEKVNPQKIKDLQTIRTNIINKGKVALKKAKTDSERSDIKLRIEKELEPVEIAIKKMALTNAEATLQNKEASTYKTMVTTPTPRDLSLKQQNLKARTASSNRSNSGAGGDISTEKLIEQQIEGGGTPTTRGIPAPASKKGLPPDPDTISVLGELSAVTPTQLLGWTKEDIQKAVEMIQQKFPKMHPLRIKRLIEIQRKRSKN